MKYGHLNKWVAIKIKSHEPVKTKQKKKATATKSTILYNCSKSQWKCTNNDWQKVYYKKKFFLYEQRSHDHRSGIHII